MWGMTLEQYNQMVKERKEREIKPTYNPYQYNTPLTEFFRSKNEDKTDKEIEMVELNFKRNGK